jgi:hypothetical protein
MHAILIEYERMISLACTISSSSSLGPFMMVRAKDRRA